MYLISQTMIYLLLALLVGGAIGYAFRACLADTACDDVRDDLALAQARLQEMEEMEERAGQAKSVPVSGLALFPGPGEPAPRTAFVPEPIVTLADTNAPLPVAPEMGGKRDAAATLAELSARDLETALLAAAPGTSPKARFEADDLTAIKGLTPQMDKWLAGFGVTRLADIASLTPSELYWLVENLPGDGSSVYRDHWVAQATAMLAKA
jgi:predicted flap endonuclease-1-like 5' DNA nuclease